jgi:CheY-like chemotaxis protein
MEEALKEEARRKDDFLALLGHELRNPLAPIGNAVYLLRMGGQTRDVTERACSIVERQVAHMARLVDDLLDVSRISRGKIQLQSGPMDLGAAVRAVLADYGPVLDQRGLRLEADLPPGPLPILADQARIVQAVSNLLHNASKFTDPGGRVAVSVGTGAAGWGFVRVKDTGVGIDPDLLASIFEPFMQGQGTVQRSQGGLGLGLALVKGLAALHGGEVTVHSDGPGLGSEFTLHLPLLLAGAGPAPALQAPGHAGAGGRRILVVEDLADSALTLRLLLEMLGHTVAVGADGASGLELAARFRPEIILCDIGLPGGLSGHDLARRVRALPGLEDTHLIALSGFGTPEDKAKAAEAGFAAHLTKPVDPALLGPLIEAVPVRAGAAAPRA